MAEHLAVIGNDGTISTEENYRRFARLEAHGRSSLYEHLTLGVAGDRELLKLLSSLPVSKRQPNLLLGVVQYLYGTASEYSSFRRVVLDRWDEVSSTMLARRTQTNEVGRCATVLPVLAALPQPLALFEVGASAGLCLLPDRYRYDYGDGTIGPVESPVVLRCETRGFKPPLLDRVPEVVWRAGIDLDPVDVGDESATRWLEALVWPGEGDRLARLRAAIDVARRDPPRVARSDLRADLGAFLADAPSEATLVILHSAVMAYVEAVDRKRFGAQVAKLGAVWVANEGAGVIPELSQHLASEELAENEGNFILACDGRPMAWTDPHGSWVHWRAVGNRTS